MARLDYNEDNYFETENRGERYSMYVQGRLELSNLTWQEADALCDRYVREYGYEYNEIEIR